METLLNINLNYIVLFLIAIYIMQGFHKGALISFANTVGMVVSWLVGYLFSPLLSKSVSEGSFYRFLLYFTEGSTKLQNPADANLLVDSLSNSQIENIVGSADFPSPFSSLVTENMDGRVFEPQGIHTVAEYMDATIANVVVNIFTFLIIYILSRVIIALVMNTMNFASPLPVLKRLDSTIGAGIGVVRGILGMFAFFMLVPVLLISMPTDIDIVSQIVNNSSFATFFYESNFLLNMITGVL
ncbi:MAG: CvpA family protein [Christensenellaceae bacterium]|jgi:hypothetical protein